LFALRSGIPGRLFIKHTEKEAHIMTFSEIITRLDNFAWGPVMLVLLVGTGVYLSIRLLFPQFVHFGYAMKNTVGRMFKKHHADEGEISPWQALTTALAATVGTGNIAGVTGAIVAGGPGAVFWMWLSALFGMATKYAEAVLAVNYRERNVRGEWVGGPMYYIKNGLGKNWSWLSSIFCVFGAFAAFGIGNMAQINTIATSVNNAIDSFGGNTAAISFRLFNQTIPVSSLIIGVIIAFICSLVLLGGIKRIGSVTALDLNAQFDSNFSDVKPGDYYYNAIGTAKAMGITSGVGNNRVGADQGITRQDMATILVRALKAAGKDYPEGSIEDLNAFDDAHLIAEYAKTSLATLVKAKILQGYNRILDPNGSFTMQHAAVVIYKIYNR